jgi:hypothetical protein
MTLSKLEILPTASDLKFSQVFGTVSLNSSMKTVPAGAPSTVMSKKTIGRRSTSEGVGTNDFDFSFESVSFDEISLALIGIGKTAGAEAGTSKLWTDFIKLFST